jgi:hypothetical protein
LLHGLQPGNFLAHLEPIQRFDPEKGKLEPYLHSVCGKQSSPVIRSQMVLFAGLATAL